MIKSTGKVLGHFSSRLFFPFVFLLMCCANTHGRVRWVMIIDFSLFREYIRFVVLRKEKGVVREKRRRANNSCLSCNRDSERDHIGREH